MPLLAQPGAEALAQGVRRPAQVVAAARADVLRATALTRTRPPSSAGAATRFPGGMRAAVRRKLLSRGRGRRRAASAGGLAGGRGLERLGRARGGRPRYASVASVPARSVAIVPGARVVNGKPFVHLRGRLETALMLYQGGRVKTILVSGNDTAEAPEVTAMSAWLRERGVAATTSSSTTAAHERARRWTAPPTSSTSTTRSSAPRTSTSRAACSWPSRPASTPSPSASRAPSARSARYMRNEALKTTLAFFESFFQRGQSPTSTDRLHGDAVATR